MLFLGICSYNCLLGVPICFFGERRNWQRENILDDVCDLHLHKLFSVGTSKIQEESIISVNVFVHTEKSHVEDMLNPDHHQDWLTFQSSISSISVTKMKCNNVIPYIQ